MLCSCGLRILIILGLILVVATVYPNCNCSTSMCYCCEYYNTDELVHLSIDYDCQEPNKSRIPEQHLNTNDVSYYISQNNNCLTKLPENICDFPTIKFLQMLANQITEVPNLSCLSELVYLDLSYNKISILKSGIFDSLTKLQKVELRHNEIKTIEDGVFHSNLNSINVVILLRNNLTKLDVWSFLNITHKFCEFDVSYNLINQLTNENGHKVKPNDDRGPGYVNLMHNKLQTWIGELLQSLGFTDARSFGFFFSWGFDFRENPWICDCLMYNLLSIVKNFIYLISREYFEIYCSGQKELIVEMELDKFVCNVTEKCPSECLCQDQPAFSRFFIDCQNSGLSELPDHLPHRKNVHINLNNNSINRLDNRYYLDSVVHLDLSHNNISYISSESMDNLKSLKYLYLKNNGLEYLPENIQKLRLSELDINDNDFICNCSNAWMYKWVKSGHFIKDSSNITCRLPGDNGKDIEIQNMTSDILHCRPIILSLCIIIPIIASLIVVIIIIIICIYFRYELLTLYYIKVKVGPQIDEFKYDVFISCDDTNDDDRIWIQENILRLLNKSGLKCYISFRDGIGGEITVDKNITTLHNSRTVVVITSDTYITDSKTMFEFNEIYHHIISNKNGQLISIKRGEFPSSKIQNGYLRSLFRLKLYLSSNDKNFSNKIIKRMNLDLLESV